ncbi:MAG TPA: MmgE/PrpD family protein [Mycobacteriales bacterium]|jgi:2-methylcitrate dehydratase PrpD|nr:MmgE/PrpD family protein [Mycobacteriales bacterium]
MTDGSVSADVVAWARGQLAAGLPAAVLERTRLHVADSAGIAIAAARTSDLARAVARAIGEGTEGTGLYLGPDSAHAFGNGALIHLLDYDDVYDPGHVHLSAATLPAALCAAAETAAQGPAVPVVDAVALGNELVCRLGDVAALTSPTSNWFLTQLFGYFGATLAYGLTAGLSDAELTSALGLAYMQAAGGKEAAFGVGGTARAVYPGFAARGGVDAGRLARAGITGPARVFEGAAGLFRIYLGSPLTADGAALLTGSGWRLLDAEVKRWPCCRISHPYVAGVLDRGRLPGDPLAAAVTIRVDARSRPLCEPPAQRANPATLQDAKYSVPFLVALGLVHGDVGLATLDRPVLDDVLVQKVAATVRIEDLPAGPDEPLVVVDGVGHGRRDDFGPGELWRTVETKFVADIGFAGGTPDGARALFDALLTDDADVRSVLAGWRVDGS